MMLTTAALPDLGDVCEKLNIDMPKYMLDEETCPGGPEETRSSGTSGRWGHIGRNDRYVPTTVVCYTVCKIGREHLEKSQLLINRWLWWILSRTRFVYSKVPRRNLHWNNVLSSNYNFNGSNVSLEAGT